MESNNMTHTIFRKSCLALSVSTSLCGSFSAFAADQSLVLEEVIVTAQKRAQSLQDVPLAVSAMTGESMRDAGINDIVDLSRQVPSLQVQNSVAPVATNYRIRRVGNIGNIPTFEPAVGMFQDGAYRNRPLFSAGDMFDIERVEVLRGPQSTLYGKNTTAGVVAIYTKKPGESLEGNAQLDVGQLDGASDATMYRFLGGVSGPLTDTLGGSIGVSVVDQEHSFDSALNGSNAQANNQERQALRGQLHWQPKDALSVRLIGGYMHEDDDTTLADVYIAPGSTAAAANAFLQVTGDAQACSSNDSLDQKHCSRTPNTTRLEASEATLLVDYVLDNGWTVTSISSWDWFKFKGTVDDVAQIATPVLRFHDTQEAESWQQELRLGSAGGETIDWLGGVFYYKNDFDRGDDGDRYTFLEDTLSAAPGPSFLLQQLFGTPFPVPFAAPGQNGVYAASQDTEYVGIFGQATWNISDKFAITGGLRWQTEEKDASIDQSVTVPGLSLLSARLLVAANSGDVDRTTDEVTWSITPQYFITDDITVYATAAHGFKSGGFNVGWGTTPVDQRQFEDEDIMHYEAGLKSTLFDSRVQLALSAFYTEFDNYQDAAFVSQQFTVGNAQKVELKGFEAEGKLLLSNEISADFGVSYADLTYDKYTDGLCYPGRAPTNSATGTCDLSGEHPVNAPEWTTHLGLVYATDISWGDVYMRADWSWSDEYNTSFSADPRLVQDSYSWLNLRVGARWNNYELVAWVDNALDEDVSSFDSLLNLFNNDPSYQTFRQPPRSYGLTARMDF
jgi:iron complex outermembrane receptor protein